MFRQIVLTALVAGGIAGALAFGTHMAKAVPLIERAEVYEKAAPAQAAAHGHGSPAGAAETAEAAEWEPDDGVERTLFTLLADLVAGIGFAFVLVGAIAIRGRAVDAATGLLWGFAGFAIFSAAPALGLPPELPGSVADGVSSLAARQAWWLGTAFVTAAGLGLLAFARPMALRAIGAVVLVVPHLIGAPLHHGETGPLPAILAAEFAAVSLVSAGLFWSVLGGVAGYLWPRFAPPRAG